MELLRLIFSDGNCGIIVITGAIRGTSRTNLYEELGRQYLRFTRCFRTIVLFARLSSKGCQLAETVVT